MSEDDRYIKDAKTVEELGGALVRRWFRTGVEKDEMWVTPADKVLQQCWKKTIDAVDQQIEIDKLYDDYLFELETQRLLDATEKEDEV